MGPPEMLNLRWNAFEANTRETLREFRDEVEFFDVTVVAGDGQQVRANKLVLAGGSFFFHKILRENPHPHPLIYLKGVSYEHLISVLDFVYTGETNIVQEDLDQFLDTAKELNVKGLFENYASKNIFDKQTKSRQRVAGIHQDQVTSKKTVPSSSVSHSRTVLTPQNNTTFSQSTFKEGHDDSLVADHSNVPSGMDGQDEAERYDDDQVKNINFNDNIVLSGEYQHASARLSAAQKKQAIRTGKNPNNIYHSELYKIKGENNTELYKEEMVDSNYDMGDAEATVKAVKNEESTHDWYGWGRENDANVIWDEEQGRIVKAFSPGKKCFQCSFCTKTFDKKNKLNRHIMIHTGEKPFQCLVCSKMFPRLDQLQRHNRIHTGEKMFQCLVCSKMFPRLDQLQRHNRIHTGEKMFQCLVCSKMFSRLDHLNQHMKTNKCSMKS